MYLSGCQSISRRAQIPELQGRFVDLAFDVYDILEDVVLELGMGRENTRGSGMFHDIPDKQLFHFCSFTFLSLVYSRTQLGVLTAKMSALLMGLGEPVSRPLLSVLNQAFSLFIHQVDELLGSLRIPFSRVFHDKYLAHGVLSIDILPTG
ncbi:unnamed protein product [Phytophthora fragariaefolia]|uniref:Unnamed protein product n=1 Tax=Phytophthora fragariaefolia TaxID=1490495 RepID=A0A9W7DAD5_9STRA|nr:unnamed protein product [Phytophthora fragariaefolia]